MAENIHSIVNGSYDNWPEEVTIHTDGACRGNPGPSSIGIAFTNEKGEMVYEFAETIGVQTNNVAEYAAVKRALEIAVQQKVGRVHLKSDSQLLIRQLLGEYRVKAAGLKPLFLECRLLSSQISNVVFEHVRREFNKRADALANQVLDEAE